MSTATENASEFVHLLREFLQAHAELAALFASHVPDEIPFAKLRALVGDDDHCVLYRLKERSHSLFRRERSLVSEAVRREVLFDLAVGALFHEAMKLRESLYQWEAYAPRVAALRAASANDEADSLFSEFEGILDRSMSRIHEVGAEVRILLAQAREQLRGLLIERAGEGIVTRFLVSRRDQVDAAFPEGWSGLLEAMHGSAVNGLVEAARSLLDSAYFVDAMRTLREAAQDAASPRAEVDQLLLYAEGMQAFLEGDYRVCLSSLEGWADLGAPDVEPGFARLAASALSRLGRVVEDDEREEILSASKQLQLRLETVSA